MTVLKKKNGLKKKQSDIQYAHIMSAPVYTIYIYLYLQCNGSQPGSPDANRRSQHKLEWWERKKGFFFFQTENTEKFYLLRIRTDSYEALNSNRYFLILRHPQPKQGLKSCSSE